VPTRFENFAYRACTFVFVSLLSSAQKLYKLFFNLERLQVYQLRCALAEEA